MISFDNFHDRTIAHFAPSPLPYREPDFVSSSRSAYWDMGDAVIRASDHWAGQHGCTGQASCIWSLGQQVAPGAWANGIAAYSSFVRRKEVDICLAIGDLDRYAARIIHDAGGALPYSDWITYAQPLPAWASKVFRGPSLVPDAALRLFRKHPAVQHVVCAPQLRLDGILSGADHLRIGTRLSLPQDHRLRSDM